MWTEFSKKFLLLLSGVIRATFLKVSGCTAAETMGMEIMQIEKSHPKKTSLPPKIQFLQNFYISLTPYTQEHN